MKMPRRDPSTTITQIRIDQISVPSLRVVVTQPDGAQICVPLGLAPVQVGTAPECTIAVKDPKVSRLHCEVCATERGILVKDLGSKNGVMVGRVEVIEGIVDVGTELVIGDCRLVVQVTGEPMTFPASLSQRFGNAFGKSLAMRHIFEKLQDAARYNNPLLLVGERGTGKRTLAEAVHGASPWAAGPFISFHPEAMPPEAVEVELFGLVPGARADVPAGHAGLLEQADGGTLYITEPDQIPYAVQQRLYAALTTGVSYRVGNGAGVAGVPCRARVITAARWDLRPRVESGLLLDFLYRLLSVLTLEVPPLRARREDIPLIVEGMLASRVPPLSIDDLSPDSLAMLQEHDWPGNIRDLRSVIEMLAVFRELGAEALPRILRDSPRVSDDPIITPFLRMPLQEAKDRLEERFFKLYLTALLERTGGNVTRAAGEAGVHRVYLHRLLSKYGVEKKGPGQKVSAPRGGFHQDVRDRGTGSAGDPDEGSKVGVHGDGRARGPDGGGDPDRRARWAGR